MAPISEQRKYMQQAMKLIEALGGRVEILRVNGDLDYIISNRNCDVKYMGDRPSIGYTKQIID